MVKSISKAFKIGSVQKQSSETSFQVQSSDFKIVNVQKRPDEPLGLTVEQDVESGFLVVARILTGSVIDKQGLLHAGDVILEVNGKSVISPEDIMKEVVASKNSLQFRIAPAVDVDTPVKNNQCYMRALFDYDPTTDSLLPCTDIGLPFKSGDILQIVDQKDPIWWQAKKVEDGRIGLIPSLDLEERRKAYVPSDADYVHSVGICGTKIARRKRKKIYQSKWNTEFDKADLLLYEEVVKIPPFKRRTLALVGPHGVGRRTLKGRLINSDPEKFGGVIPHTSRPIRDYEEDGKSYWFLDRRDMENQVRNHKFLEYGEHNGHLYGTSLDSIKNVINQGKMCVLDCSASALKILHNSSEFMPYVIFIAAPKMDALKSLYDNGRMNGFSSRTLTFDRQSSIRFSSRRRARTLESLTSFYEEDDLLNTLEESACLQRSYSKFIDLTIVNDDFDKTFLKVVEALDALTNQHQWVPVNWVY